MGRSSRLSAPTATTPSARAASQLGARIRKARHEAGLSLAQVAGKDLSRPFLNQIELGQARPSTRTLQAIARRLQRPIEYFLEDPDLSRTALELALAEGETALRQGDPGRTKTLMASLLQRPHLPIELMVRVQLLLGDALLRLHQVVAAVPVLEDALRVAEQRKWPMLVAEICDRLGSAEYRQRRAVEAGRWFDRALSVYDNAKMSYPLLRARILGHRANLAYVSGQPRQAIAGYEAAIGAAGGVMDMPALAGIYEGLAMSFQQTGDSERALVFAQRSLRLWETLQDVRMSAQLRNNMAEILLEEGRPDEAERLFLEGHAQLAAIGDSELLPFLLAGAAEAALEVGALERASEASGNAVQAYAGSSDPLAGVAVHRVAARIAFASGLLPESREHFELALQLATSIADAKAISKVAYEYARTLEAIGETGLAALQYRQAYEARRLASAS
jgi:HTH-type transcriptional regulator, quorum sensing regulator NprR